MSKLQKRNGFTLIELIIVIALFGILAMMATINLMKPQTTASVEGDLLTLISDIKQQQLGSMVGDSAGLATAQVHGIYLSANSYTLFVGNSYNPTDPSNFVVNLSENVNLENITFPSSQIVFSRGSGEVSGFTNGSNTFVIRHVNGISKSVSINKLGVVTVN